MKIKINLKNQLKLPTLIIIAKINKKKKKQVAKINSKQLKLSAKIKIKLKYL